MSNGEADWASDGKNPYNWPMRKRVYHTVMPALFGLVVYVLRLRRRILFLTFMFTEPSHRPFTPPLFRK